MTESQECLSITFGEAVEFAVSETRPRPTDRSEVTAQDRPYQSAGSRLTESISSELRRPSPAEDTTCASASFCPAVGRRPITTLPVPRHPSRNAPNEFRHRKVFNIARRETLSGQCVVVLGHEVRVCAPNRRRARGLLQSAHVL